MAAVLVDAVVESLSWNNRPWHCRGAGDNNAYPSAAIYESNARVAVALLCERGLCSKVASLVSTIEPSNTL